MIREWVRDSEESRNQHKIEAILRAVVRFMIKRNHRVSEKRLGQLAGDGTSAFNRKCE